MKWEIERRDKGRRREERKQRERERGLDRICLCSSNFSEVGREGKKILKARSKERNIWRSQCIEFAVQ